MRPIHHERALGWVFHNTRQVDCASKIYKNIGSTNDACQGLWSDVCVCMWERKKSSVKWCEGKTIICLSTYPQRWDKLDTLWVASLIFDIQKRQNLWPVRNESVDVGKKVSSLAAIKAFQLDYTFNIHSLLSASWMLWKRISEVYEVVPTVNRFMSRCLTQLTVLFPIFFTKHWNEIVSKFV